MAASKSTSWLHRKLKLSRHKHTGRRLPQQHTSHGTLMVIALAAGLMLVVATKGLSVSADTFEKSGSLSLTGKVILAPPSEPAVIMNPLEGQVFSLLPITIAGSCQLNDFVQIYRNHKAVGSAACIRGQFGLKIDLVPGLNTLVVRTLDSIFQFGPNSAPVRVTYKPLNPPPLPQLLITTSSDQLAVAVNTAYSLNAEISGGQPPYAVSVRWGDGSQDVLPKAAAGSFGLSHKYSASNIYSIIVSVSDNLGNKAAAESAVLVAGPALRTSNFSGPAGSARSTMDIVWPLYGLTLASLLIFWLGEKYELIQLREALKLKKM